MVDTWTKLFVEALGKSSLSRRFRSTAVRYYHFSCTQAPNFPNFSPAHSVFYNWILIRARLIFLARSRSSSFRPRTPPLELGPNVTCFTIYAILVHREWFHEMLLLKFANTKDFRLNMSCLVNAHEYNYDRSGGRGSILNWIQLNFGSEHKFIAAFRGEFQFITVGTTARHDFIITCIASSFLPLDRPEKFVSLSGIGDYCFSFVFALFSRSLN